MSDRFYMCANDYRIAFRLRKKLSWKKVGLLWAHVKAIHSTESDVFVGSVSTEQCLEP